MATHAAVLVVLFAALPLMAQEAGTLQTSWGDPDLSGIWDYRTLTPLERPTQLSEQAVLSDEEAAEFRQQIIQAGSADRRDGGADSDIERAYNDFWYDWGNSLTDDKRTSLIVDPSDGRIPALTDEAEAIQPVRAGMDGSQAAEW